ncbi:MAG: BMP family protein [Planctomycetota bacterium]
MKNIIIGVVVLAVIGGGVGFYIHQKQEAKKAAKAAGKKPVNPNALKVGLVTPGPSNDGGWSQNAYKAVVNLEKELGAVTFKSAKGGEDAHTSFRKYASEKKADVVIGHASEYNDAKTAEIAAANPGTVFLISGSDKSDKNVVGVRFVLEDATFVLGQLAASMSKTNVLGCVGPEHLPVIESTFEAFVQGAKSVKPDIKVIVKWTEKSSDNARGSEITKQLISEGADFIFQNANAAGQGVFEAVQQNKDKGVFALGSNDDQALTMTQFDDIILASAALDISGTYLGICKKIQDKSFEKKTQFVGIAQGGVTVAPNKKLEAKIPTEVKKLIDETIEKLKKGESLYTRKELK